MTRLSYFCSLAALDREEAARAFLAEADEDAAAKVLEASVWKDTDVADFDRKKDAVMIEGRWGKFWLASSQISKKKLQPPAPIITPRDLVNLARGIVDVIQT